MGKIVWQESPMPRLARLDARPPRLSLAMAGRHLVCCTMSSLAELSGGIYLRTIKTGITCSIALGICVQPPKLHVTPGPAFIRGEKISKVNHYELRK